MSGGLEHVVQPVQHLRTEGVGGRAVSVVEDDQAERDTAVLARLKRWNGWSLHFRAPIVRALFIHIRRRRLRPRSRWRSRAASRARAPRRRAHGNRADEARRAA